MWFVYLIKNKFNNEKYIGFTNDIERRIAEHNSKQNRSTITKKGKWQIVYYEAFKNQKDAIAREKRLKQHGRARQELYKRCYNSLLEK